jgi:hypothetical protein
MARVLGFDLITSPLAPPGVAYLVSRQQMPSLELMPLSPLVDSDATVCRFMATLR